MAQRIINGKVYISMASLKNGEYLPYRGWTNMFVDSDGNLYNERTLNGHNPRPAVYYANKGKYTATITRPVKLVGDSDDKRTKLTAYKHLILEMLPRPFPTTTEVTETKPKAVTVTQKPTPVKPKPLDEEHEKIDMYHLFPDDEWAEQTFDGLQITHRMNLYRDGKLETWRNDVTDDKGDDFTAYYNRMICGLYYKTEIEKRFQTYMEQDKSVSTEQDTDETPLICIAELYGMSEFTEWFYDSKKDVFIHNGETVNWNIEEGEPVINLVQGSAIESMTYDDLVDLINY